MLRAWPINCTRTRIVRTPLTAALFLPKGVLFFPATLPVCSLLLACGCQSTTIHDPVVSNESTPVQKLEVTVGSHLELRLPSPAIGRWWTVAKGARPWLLPKTEPDTGRILLHAVQVGSTRVTCIQRDRNNFEYRKVVVDVEVKPVS